MTGNDYMRLAQELLQMRERARPEPGAVDAVGIDTANSHLLIAARMFQRVGEKRAELARVGTETP